MTRVSPFARNYIRSRSSDLMTDVCQIYRPGSGQVTYDPVTHRATNADRTPLYEGPCRLWQVPTSNSQTFEGQDILVSQMYLSLPWNAMVPEPEDQAKILVSDDPTVVGRYYQIEAIERAGGLRASRRLLVQAIDSPSTLW